MEPSDEEPGVFWLNASGLGRIEPSLARWARRILADLREEGFVARAAVGFTRFGTYAVARTVRHIAVLKDRSHEGRLARGVRLDRLHLDADLRDTLAKLKVHTVGDFLALPPEGLGKRFGGEALDFYRKAGEDAEKPLAPVPPPEPLESWVELDRPEADAIRLLFLIKRLLPSLLSELADKQQGLTELTINLVLDDGSKQSEAVRPAEPTLDAALILDLVRLQLGSSDFTSGAVEVTLTVRSVPISAEQLALFMEKPRRDLSAANRAFARIRAEFGRRAVVWAKQRDGHLPEATFTWEPLEEARFPSEESRAHGHDIRRPPLRTLVRRMFEKPRPLPARQRHEPDGWLVCDLEQGPAVRLLGPYVISGGWWVRDVHREHHFVETKRGDVLWVYYDRQRRRWFLQGRVQ